LPFDVAFMSGIGRDLRAARERTGLPLRELSARTKIREPVLDALEREDFAALPAGILRRGYLRAYASEVGLDPEAVVERYRHDFGSRPPAAPATPTSARVDATRLRHSRGLRKGAAVGVLAAITALIVQTSDAPMTQKAFTPSAVATTGQTGAGMPEPAPERPPADARVVSSDVAATAVASSLTVEIDPAGVVWVEATADGARVLYTLVYPGQRRVVRAEQWLVLRVGDAGAFDYSINGVRGRPLGAHGEVREVRITRDNHTSFQDRPRA
jgi:cytoskeletal protein RodZ